MKIATDQDVAEGRFTPFDVVLPLPGHDVIYPSHRVGALYQYVLIFPIPHSLTHSPHALIHLTHSFTHSPHLPHALTAHTLFILCTESS